MAKVNGTPISMAEFNDHLQTKATVRVTVQGQSVELPVADTLAFQAVQDLVAQKLLLQVAADEGVAPTDEDVEAEIKFKVALQPNYLPAMKTRGFTTGQVRQLTAVQLAQERLATKGITVTDEEVQRRIKENPNLFVEPEKASLELLFVRGQDTRSKAEQALRSGTPFTSVRQQFDQAPLSLRNAFDVSRASGDGMAIEGLNEPFKSAVRKTDKGKLTDWMRAGDGWAKILVHSKMPKKEIERTPERMEFLKRQIALEKAAEKNDVNKKVADKLRSSKIEVVEASLKDPWQRFEERLKKQAEETRVPTEAAP